MSNPAVHIPVPVTEPAPSSSLNRKISLPPPPPKTEYSPHQVLCPEQIQEANSNVKVDIIVTFLNMRMAIT
jgi:hypothetical protein